MTDIEDPADCKPLRISWSALLRHEECHFKEMAYRDGRRVDIVDGRNFIPGTIADLTMRKWLEQADPKEGELVPLIDDVFEEVAIRNPERHIKWRGNPSDDQKAVRATVKEALERLEPWLVENVLPYDYQPEARGRALLAVPDVDGTLKSVQMFFAVDIAVRPDKFALYDLKVTRDDRYTRGKTLGQLTFYAIAWAAHHGITLRDIDTLAFVTPLTKQLVVPTQPTGDDFRYMMTRITSYAQGVWANDRSTKEKKDSNCSYRCDVRTSCPLFAVPQQESGRVSFSEVVRRRKEGTQ